jgi:hypothetical protein
MVGNDPVGRWDWLGLEGSSEYDAASTKIKSLCTDGNVNQCNNNRNKNPGDQDCCTIDKCNAEADEIAKKYVEMWNAKSNAPNAFRTGERSNAGDCRSGWMCYHWRTHTYDALTNNNKIYTCFDIKRRGMLGKTKAGKPSIKHNWVTIMVGMASLRLDPWRKPGPDVYTPEEHYEENCELQLYDKDNTSWWITLPEPGIPYETKKPERW